MIFSHAMFRSFLALAEELGIVDPGEGKRSAPPSISLRTGRRSCSAPSTNQTPCVQRPFAPGSVGHASDRTVFARLHYVRAAMETGGLKHKRTIPSRWRGFRYAGTSPVGWNDFT